MEFVLGSKQKPGRSVLNCLHHFFAVPKIALTYGSGGVKTIPGPVILVCYRLLRLRWVGIAENHLPSISPKQMPASVLEER